VGIGDLELSNTGHDGAMTVLGAVVLPQLPPERLREVAILADTAGLDEIWLWEDCFWPGGIATASAALAWTERIRVGVGLLPVPLRNVALTAMEVAALHRLFPGRLRIGVGHGVQDWMGQVGARVESPMTLLREYVTALRELLTGEQVTVDGRYVHLDAVKLDWPPQNPTEILIGATGPQTLRLSGAIGDGTILTGSTSMPDLHRARDLVDEGSAGTGRKPSLIVYLVAATGPGAQDRLHAEWRRQGRDTAADTSPDVGVAGDATEVAAAVRRWTDAGADTVVLQPTFDDPDPIGFIRFVATEVRPLVSAG
jgi:alkanesulfonate monooxygenase SsuD/methylene tetrahydromethanopterin reductase-like flavin-dependent oxidoreductase (luciferase family)